jgi:hypothetical protein
MEWKTVPSLSARSICRVGVELVLHQKVEAGATAGNRPTPRVGTVYGQNAVIPCD